MRLPVALAAGLALASPVIAQNTGHTGQNASRRVDANGTARQSDRAEPTSAHRSHAAPHNAQARGSDAQRGADSNAIGSNAIAPIGPAGAAPDWLDPPVYSDTALRDRFDHDSDGALDARERTQVAEFLRQEARAHHQWMLVRFDTDGDAALSARERAHARELLRAEAERRNAALVKRFDADADGRLTGEERALARATDPDSAEHLDQFQRMRAWAQRRRNDRIEEVQERQNARADQRRNSKEAGADRREASVEDRADSRPTRQAGVADD